MPRRLIGGSRLAAIAVGLLATASAPAATLTVTTTADPTSATACTLRDAIASINAGADSGNCVASGSYGTADTISFAVSGTGLHMITLASSLPAIVKPMTINGFSQSGSSANS